VLLSRALAFSAITLIYLGLGWLNYEQVARLGSLGLSDILVVSAWTTRRGTETKVGKFCVLAVVFLFLLFMSYHGFLREFFGVAADDDAVLSAVFNSDRTEAGEFIEQQARTIIKHVAVVLGFTCLFALLVFRWPATAQRGTTGHASRRRWITAAAFLGLFVLIHLNSSMRNMDPVMYFPARYSAWKKELRSSSQLQAKMAAAANDPELGSLRLTDDAPRTIVFLLSESITRLNYPYAGYARKTTPELEALGTELTWFSDVISCDGSTVPAIRKILTPATIAEPDLWLSKADLFLMARKVGYKTFWLSNHTTDANAGVSVFVSHADKAVLANRGGARGEGSFDEVLLPLLREALEDPSPRKLILLHLLGAHPAYYYRYPKAFARFNHSHDTVAQELKASGRAFWAIAMRNYYDNALLYSDHVLKRTLDLCRASGQRVAWLFVPDHGQDAAHYNNFCGHNARVPSQYEIPMIFWRSASFPESGVSSSSLGSRPYQTDVLDHTLLGLMGINGDYYDPQRDIFSTAFEPVPRSVNGKPWVSGMDTNRQVESQMAGPAKPLWGQGKASTR
jgi:heptose-I-phosphate ethanolaminephosphotransferase